MRNTVLAIGAAALLAGCAVYTEGDEVSFGKPIPATLSSNLTADEVAWSKVRGANSITGQAIMRTRGGDVKTCAGLDVSLIPYSAYAAERIAVTYGAEDEGFARRESRPFSPDPAVYHETIRRSICDAQGNFRFTGLPDGRYFVLVEVSWEAVQGGRYAYLAGQGGTMMSRVSVSGGEERQLLLTAN